MTEPAIEMIDRKRIAELAGVKLFKVVLAARIQQLDMPKPKAKKRSGMPYDQAEILAWLEKTPIKDISLTSERFAAEMGVKIAPSKEAGQRLDNRLAVDFMRGRYATPWRQWLHNRRLRKARENRPKRQRVHIHEAPNAPEALRADLVRQTGEERQTLAGMAGRAFY